MHKFCSNYLYIWIRLENCEHSITYGFCLCFGELLPGAGADKAGQHTTAAMPEPLFQSCAAFCEESGFWRWLSSSESWLFTSCPFIFAAATVSMASASPHATIAAV